MRLGYAELIKRTLVVVAAALLPFLFWYLFDVVLIVFGAIIVAMLLWLGAEPFMRWLRMRESLALVLSGIIILMILVLAGYLFGTRVGDQLQDVVQRVNSGAAALQSVLEHSKLGAFLASHFSGSGFSLTGILTGFLKISTGIIAGLAVALVSGIYIAAQPRLYRDGLVQLFPPERHAWASERIEAIAGALRLWLIGQLIQMLLIGLLSMLVAWLVGVPSPIALGLIAAVAEFIPYLGPIIAAIPAVLVATTVGWHAVLWIIVGYIAIHQTEGQLIVPLIQRYFVFIPPAVILLGIAAFTSLFGVPGAIFAAPMSVVIFVAVKMLYVRDKLGERTEIPGDAS